jgi:hypothetical protein
MTFQHEGECKGVQIITDLQDELALRFILDGLALTLILDGLALTLIGHSKYTS